MKKHTLVFFLFNFFFCILFAQTGNITTIAGNGLQAYSGDGGLATAAELYLGTVANGDGAGVDIDAAGNIYIADAKNNRIRKISTSGIISTIAGTGVAGWSGDNGLATAAKISDPICVRIDNTGNIYFSDAGNAVIREINSSGIITSIAGQHGTQGYSGDNNYATASKLNFPTGLALDNNLNLYIADENNNVIREITSSNHYIQTVAGNGIAGYTGDGGLATTEELNGPTGVAVDNSGNIYIADLGNNMVREVIAGQLENIAGTPGVFTNFITSGPPLTLEISPTGISSDALGNLFFSDAANSAIYEIPHTNRNICYSIAGTGNGAYNGDNIPATSADLYSPFDVITDANDNIYIADEVNSRIRKITNACSSYTATISIVSPVECNGNSNGVISAGFGSSFAPFTYSWSPAGNTTQTLSGLSAGTYSVSVMDIFGCTATNSITLTQPNALVISISSVTNATCSGGTGSITANTASGGTSPYNYRWTPSGGTNRIATGLSAGGYTITVSDNHGCTASVSATITQPTILSVTTITTANESCFGGNTGSASANVSGSISPYTYSWSPSGGSTTNATGLSAGTYTIHVTSNSGCTASSTVVITQPANMVVTAVITANVSCFGGANGSSTTAVTGGTSPFTYSWSPSGGSTTSATGLSAGTYTIHVTSNTGCTASATIVITQPAAAFGISISSVTSINCYGGTGSITASVASGGTSPYNYSWTSGEGTRLAISGLSAGVYTITATDNHGCKSTASATITQPASALGISIASISSASCNGQTGSATASAATGGIAPYTYTWSGGGGTSLIASSLSAGTYTFTVTDNHGCTETTSATITQPATSLSISISAVNSISCYGGSGNVIANAATGGTSPYTYSWSSGGGNLVSASGLSAGTYTITATDNHGCQATASAVITQPASPLGVSVSSVTNITCTVSGSATANPATGGTVPYTYNWAPAGGTSLTATGLSAGTYTLSVTDNHGCTAMALATITQPASALNISISGITNVLCNGGSGSASANSANGGSSPYTYSWSPAGGTGLVATGLSAGAYTITVTDNVGCTSLAIADITQPTLLGITILSVANANCYGDSGSITASAATGGTFPYTYNWSAGGSTNNTAIGITAGTYTLTVNDNNGCVASVSAVITQPSSPLGITISSVTNASCNVSGSIVANIATGGTSPYNYNWSPTGGSQLTASGLSAGVYTITVTDSGGCSATASASITEPANPVGIEIAAFSNIACFGGNGSATSNPATGGTAPYTYSWVSTGGTNLSATGLSAGTYTISVTDNIGCGAFASVTITQPEAVTIVSTINSNVSCYGNSDGSASVSASGGTGAYTYSWLPAGGNSSGASDITAGTYTVLVTDNNGCSATVSATISQPAILTATHDSVNQTGSPCNGAAAVIPAGGTAPYTFLWSGGQTTDTITGQCSGSFCCVITDNNGCSLSTCVTVIYYTGINPIENLLSVAIYPDPNTGYFTVSGISAGHVIELYNSLGQLISKMNSENPDIHYNISSLPNGIYLIRIIDDNGNFVTDKKVIKTQ